MDQSVGRLAWRGTHQVINISKAVYVEIVVRLTLMSYFVP